MLRLPVMLELLAALATWSPASAGVPSPSNSYVARRLVSCPAGDSSFVVITRHASNSPWSEGCCITIDLCSCPGYHLSGVGTHPYTVDPGGCVVSVDTEDAMGYALFPLAGGGLCPGDSIRVYAEGILMSTRTKVVSLDQNGDLRVNDADVAIVQSKLGTLDLTADFDGDGQVNEADVTIVRGHLGHVAPDATTAVPPMGPGLIALSAPQPNPFSREARFTLTLDRTAHVVVAVGDLTGRRVAMLFDGDASPGPHTFAWQGRRADGSSAPSGIYFLQVHAGDERLVRRTIFLGTP